MVLGGYLVVTAKINLINHYIKTLIAQHSSRNQLVIPFKSAKYLLKNIFDHNVMGHINIKEPKGVDLLFKANL
jgi:hypothetical protein